MLHNEELALMQVTWFCYDSGSFTRLRYRPTGHSVTNMQTKLSNKLFAANRRAK
jgi:hypothetical protein